MKQLLRLTRISHLSASALLCACITFSASSFASAQENTGGTPGSVFRDCADCPEMVVVPAGSYMMGSAKGDFDEKPVHEVAIAKPFAIGKYEVTWDEWDACVASGACDNGPVVKSGGDNGWGKGRRPVIEVSWHDAKAFVGWLNSKVPGEPYRLPTEAEWEYAARAGTETPFHWGEEFDPTKANDGNKLVPVGSFPANAFGLHDMLGNALEWIEDCYAESYKGAPANGGPAPETPDCQRVLRSGAWSYGPRVLRAADRYAMPPGDRVNILGFRVVKSL